MSHHHEVTQPDYGTGQKTLGIYLIGIISCAILTVIAFWAVMSGKFTQWGMFTIIYSAAIVQFLVQLICFLRLNTKTEQGKMNVMSFIFSMVILICIVIGSLWIMWNMNYYMTH